MIDFADVFSAGGLAALAQVVMIDLLLAGDNVMVMGTLAAGLPAVQRRRVLAIGVGIALVCLIGFALIATTLLKIVGLLFAGGLLLLWVAWKLYRELRGAAANRGAGALADGATQDATGALHQKSFAGAIIQVALADLSMSLDNVLAVAGAARDHPTVLFFGLALSVTLMGLAANFIARLIERYHWLAYLGLVVICYVAGSMIYHGVVDPEIGVMALMPKA
ncbi:MAG: YjbE family putative metal transport protein [Sphingomonas sp.]